ncbi:MAG: beta-ketoacyl-[acyl-carrier-protein] synthase family protein [Planctomycetes bacterium]|nr:beta-ketoacyl-[acyl-carrier-protein] synthase family protein [Planctomycetota bacterium]
MRRVAVTGLGVVAPNGVGVPAFWRALRAGESGIGRIASFDAGGFEVQLAGEVEQQLSLEPEERELARGDRKVGFALAACREALAQAGVAALSPASLLHLGTSLEVFDLGNLVAHGRVDFPAAVRRALAPGGRALQHPLDAAVRRLVQVLGRPGRALTNCSACTAGAQAIGHAFREVRAGRCDLALCGGFDSMVNPLGVGGFQLLGALSTDNARGPTACRPFDAARRGTVLGEGAAAVVLEPLEHALARGMPVLGEVVGYGSTLDAHGLSAPDPQGAGAVRAMRAALDDAGVAPARICHANAHGTGTLLNDEIEARAIREVFAATWPQLPVSATKSTTGHLIGAAGAVEFAACLLALAAGEAPPNPSLDKVGAGCELCHVVGGPARLDGEFALTNSFGFGGQNAAIVLRRAHGG